MYKLFYIKSGNRYINENLYKVKLRNPDQHKIPKPNLTLFIKNYTFLAPRIFNMLPTEIKNSKNCKIFTKRLKEWLLSLDDVEFLLHIPK